MIFFTFQFLIFLWGEPLIFTDIIDYQIIIKGMLIP